MQKKTLRLVVFCGFGIILKMYNQNEHFRHIMLFYFKKGKSAAQTCNKICAVYGEDAVKERVCQKWFARFCSGNFSIQDASRSERPRSTATKVLVDTNQRYTTSEIADVLQISKSSVGNHLHQLDYISRLDVWIPHELSEAHLIERISISDSFRKAIHFWSTW